MIDLSFIGNPWFYVLAVPAVLSIGIAKGGIGGIGSLAVPLISLVVTVPQAAGILLPIMCFADIFAVWTYRKIWDKRNLKIIIPGSMVGIVVGTASFRFLDPLTIKLMIGIIAVWFATHSLFGQGRVAEPKGPNAVRGGFWSAVCGFTSFVAHAGAPPLSVYMLPQRLERTLYVGTLAMFYAVVNYAKIGPYAWLGQLHATNLMTSAVLLPLVPVGVLLGRWMHRAVNDDVFYRIILTILFVTGVKLAYDSLTGLYWQ
ncbi:MAG: sulfite exporter TauE/SafE family protein [Nitrospiraceae bacterium]